MKMVSFIINFDGTFSPCSQGGEWFLAKLDREKMANYIYSVVPMIGMENCIRLADALIAYLTE